MKHYLILLLLGLVWSIGCVHPPPPAQKEIPFSTLPAKVTQTLNARFPDAEIKKVVEWCFDGQVICYYIDYAQAGSPVKTVAITPKGEVTDYDRKSTSK